MNKLYPPCRARVWAQRRANGLGAYSTVGRLSQLLYDVEVWLFARCSAQLPQIIASRGVSLAVQHTFQALTPAAIYRQDYKQPAARRAPASWGCLQSRAGANYGTMGSSLMVEWQ